VKTAIAAALLLGLAPAVARAQATAPGFRTGFCVAPDTSGTLHPALAAMVSEPAEPPQLRPGSTMPAFPDEVHRDGYQGLVVLAFVVDTLGRVVPETAEVVRSTDPALSRWGCRVVGTLRFAPARHEGRPVFAQAMQPFTYSAKVRK
jgi:outer membrane biosynthesis protein TonB